MFNGQIVITIHFSEVHNLKRLSRSNTQIDLDNHIFFFWGNEKLRCAPQITSRHVYNLFI